MRRLQKKTKQLENEFGVKIDLEGNEEIKKIE